MVQELQKKNTMRTARNIGLSKIRGQVTLLDCKVLCTGCGFH